MIETLPKRFQNKIEPVTESGCWIWTANCLPSGYGRIRWNKTEGYSHRFVYELLIGPIPNGMQIDHLCRVRACCNPAHLEAVSARVNLSRSQSFSAENSRKTHCVNGHPYSGENLRIVKSNGNRKCRICNREALLRFKAKNPTYMKDKLREYYWKEKALAQPKETPNE